jgi:hypothetical protein
MAVLTRLDCCFAPGGFRVGEGIEHQLAPGERCVDGQMRMAGAKAAWRLRWTVAGAVTAISKLG